MFARQRPAVAGRSLSQAKIPQHAAGMFRLSVRILAQNRNKPRIASAYFYGGRYRIRTYHLSNVNAAL